MADVARFGAETVGAEAAERAALAENAAQARATALARMQAGSPVLPPSGS